MEGPGTINSPSIRPILLDQTQFDELWQSALKKYKDDTGRDLLDDPLFPVLETCTSIDSVASALSTRVKDFEKFRSSGHKFWAAMEIIARVMSIGVETAGEVGAAMSSKVPGGKAIFVAMGRLLQATRGVSEAYNAVEIVFSKLETFLERLKVHVRSPASITPLLSDHFAKILVELLMFMGLLIKYVDESVGSTPLGRTVRSLSRTIKRTKDLGNILLEKSEVGDALKRFDNLTNEELLATAATVLVVVQETAGVMNEVQNGVNTTVRDMREIANNQINENIRKWLDLPDPGQNYDRLRKERQTGTCEWIFDAKFEEWKQRSNAIYWTYGNPGTGKSVLSSAVIKRLVYDNALVIYFYFDFRDKSKQTLTGLLSSLIFQLAVRSAACYNTLKDLHARNQSMLHPNEELLTGRLVEMLNCCSDIFIILDALDECPETTRYQDLLPFLESLMDLNINGLHLLMTSRPESDIKASFHNRSVATLDICDGAGHDRDIAWHIERELARPAYSKWPQDTKDMAKNVLLSKANGVFLWVNLQLQSLRNCPSIDVKDALHNLPRDLSDTYTRIFERLSLNPPLAERARRVLECIVFGIEDQSNFRNTLDVERYFGPNELAEVLAVDFAASDGATLRAEHRPMSPIDSLLESCLGLFQIVDIYHFGKIKQRVRFTHFTVKEYLLSKPHLGDFRSFALTAESGYVTMTLLCLATLTSFDPNPSLLCYASCALSFHVDRCPNNAQVERSFLRFTDPKKPYFARFCDVNSLDNSQPLYWAASKGLIRQVEMLLNLDSVNIDAIGGRDGTALCAAAKEGHLETVQLLVNRGATIETSGVDISPLNCAAGEDHAEIVSFLLDHGARIDSRGYKGQTALHAAINSGTYRDSSINTALLLLKRGLDVDVVDEEGCTPLHLASELGEPFKAQLLLWHGAAINARNNAGQIPLHYACGCGDGPSDSTILVPLLLKHGASLNSQDRYGSTPLHYVAMSGWFHIIRILLEDGAKVDLANCYGRSPFHLAIIHMQARAARLLLNWGASPSVSLAVGWTVLHMIASNQRTYDFSEIDELLCFPELGLDLEARTDCGQTAISIASAAGRPEAVGCFIEVGANINAADSNGFRPIDYAAASGHADVIRLLLEHGADGWTESRLYGTFLDIAARAHRVYTQNPENRIWEPKDWRECKWLPVPKMWRDPENLRDLEDLITKGRKSTVSHGERMMRRVRRYRSMGCIPICDDKFNTKELDTSASAIDDMKRFSSDIAWAMNHPSEMRLAARKEPVGPLRYQSVFVLRSNLMWRVAKASGRHYRSGWA